MDVQLEKSSPTLASLTVKLTKEDYQAKVDKSIKDYAKKASLKGFRPGKVPPHVITRMYGKSIKVDEINHMLSHAVTDYIRDNKIQIVGDPLPNREQAEAIDWDTQTDFEFVYDLGVATDFEVDLSEIAAVPHYTITADEKEVQESIDKLRDRFSDPINPETSELGDTLFGELKQESSEFTTNTAIPTKRVKEDQQAKFLGAKKDDTIVFDIQGTFEDEAAIAHVTGKKKENVGELAGEFTFVVNDITRTAPAELNQEFFDKVLGPGKVENEEDFRAEVAKIIEENYARETETLLRRDLEKALLDEIKIDLPADFLKDWLERTNEGKFTRQQIEEQFEDFEKSMKLSLIKNRIAEQTDIKVEYPEIMEYTKNMMRGQFGMYGNDDSMDEVIERVASGYLADREKDNYSTIFNQVFDLKVLDAIRNEVATEERTIDVEEFEKIVKANGGVLEEQVEEEA
ncbi:trigger factor [Persicitalea jodogahamensis]|uniref:Trigger factor n=1 Tax=Persicitalea jodogahamensis TaxID=402147 RepID=A0A8J3GAE0_9BACT|nr:trigger factor [Persicitalea jodogahamensis]GHB69716.1 trigger factor [Persicitalea jodogahamensis]